MEQVERNVFYVVYAHEGDDEARWVEQFNTKKGATAYAKENFTIGMTKCCAMAYAVNDEGVYGYGDTQTEAIRALDSKLKPFGMKSYDPYTVR